MTATMTANPGGFLLVLSIVLPVAGVLLVPVVGARHAERVVGTLLLGGLCVAVAVLVKVRELGAPLVYHLGGWAPPLGIALRADGLSAVMTVTTAVLMGGAALYAGPAFAPPATGQENRRAPVFQTLLMGLWCALNAVWFGADLFGLYVALELLTFAAVPLVALDGSAATLEAALRYLLFVLAGSALYLLGVALLYGAYGTLDIGLLAGLIRPGPTISIAAALMIAGLAAKTALFPLHLWLPPAHAGAPAAASALLSALVVKGSFFLILRIWVDLMPGLPSAAAAQLLGALGAGAIIFGGVLALRQARLKLMIAYSTVAQIGYLFFIFPLIGGPGWNGIAWTGGMLQLLAHAFAKAAMFMAAGLIGEALGHDRITGLTGLGRALPVTVFAFGLSGMSLIGLPPSGGFVAKAMLLTAAVGEGQWWWAVVILAGGLLAAGYILRVVVVALTAGEAPLVLRGAVSRGRQGVVLALAIGALALGFVPLRASPLLAIGGPGMAATATP